MIDAPLRTTLNAIVRSCPLATITRTCGYSTRLEFNVGQVTTAAGVLSVTRLRLWSLASVSSRLGRAASRSSSANT
jgi:hypothetical protein